MKRSALIRIFLAVVIAAVSAGPDSAAQLVRGLLEGEIEVALNPTGIAPLSAEATFRQSLLRAPNNGWALHGLAAVAPAANITLISNRFDVAQRARELGFTTRFSDFDFSGFGDIFDTFFGGFGQGGLESLAVSRRTIRPFVEEFVLKGGRRVNVLGEGRLINLAAAEGHPAMVMDMSFANQSLSLEYLKKKAKTLGRDVYTVPRDIDMEVARLKLKFAHGSVELGGDEIRWVLRRPNGEGLRSALLTKVDVRKKGGRISRVRIEGQGYGHGVGMCQFGAMGMAEAGYRHDQIIRFYYRGSKVARLY